MNKSTLGEGEHPSVGRQRISFPFHQYGFRQQKGLVVPQTKISGFKFPVEQGLILPLQHPKLVYFRSLLSLTWNVFSNGVKAHCFLIAVFQFSSLGHLLLYVKTY